MCSTRAFKGKAPNFGKPPVVRRIDQQHVPTVNLPDSVFGTPNARPLGEGRTPSKITAVKRGGNLKPIR